VEAKQASEMQRLGDNGKRSALGGLVVRRYRWTLSGKAKLLLLATIITLALMTWLSIYPFLAETRRVDGDVLVVEGWVHPYAIRAGVEEFKSHAYRKVFTTGGPVTGKGGYINDFQTSASVGAESLVRTGLPAEVVQMVPSHEIGRDRTYSSAIALRDWLIEHKEQTSSFNILTEGAHARRTRLMFQKAFGPNVKVGVISILSPDFDAKHWWHYSEGTEDVIEETIAYLYAKFFFPRTRHAHELSNS
jgi:uncharacterized SAM-binding protein YcdF (DUF218 family)